MAKKKTIDDFFKPTSLDVAEKMIGMDIEYDNGIYTVSATKPYFGESRQTKNKARQMYGGIMMFNVRGNPHFCVSTGKDLVQDYFLIHGLIGEEGEQIKNAKGVSEALELDYSDEGKRFADIFNLTGKTQPSTFKKNSKRKKNSEASTCLGVYELAK